MQFTVNSLEETIQIGKFIGEKANKGDIICITGDLGTGKTYMTKGIAEGLKIKDCITSPTFNIVNEYHGRLKMYHFDVYRVNDPYELMNIGFDEYIFSDAVSVIEWANYIEELIPDEHLSINIEKVDKNNLTSRKITINYFGDRYDYIKEITI